LLLSRTIEHFINGLYAENKSAHTIFNYRHNLSLLEKSLPKAKLLDIRAEELRTFLASRAQGRAAATTHQAFRVLRTFFKWCVREGLLESSPVKNIKAPKLEYKVVSTFTTMECNALLQICPQKTFLGERNRSIILCLLDTGMRAHELVNLRLNDVDFRLGIVKVMGKGGKERLMRLGEKARQTLWRYMLIRDVKAPPTREYLFLSEEMKPLTRNGLTTIIAKLGKKAGISKVRCSPHTFRHTFAVQFLRAGGNIRDLQQLGGWSDLSSVVRYTSSLSIDDALRAHEKFSPADHLLT
jgi:integrase/recombinase XerC/integrase/recombinase XerD